MESAWEGWIRPLLIIVVVLVTGLGWYFEWFPDAAVGWFILGAGGLVGAGVVGANAWHEAGSAVARWLGVAVIVGALALLAWAPVRQAGPEGLLVSGEIAGSGQLQEVPKAGSGDWVIYLHGAPIVGKDAAKKVRMALAFPGAAEPRVHMGALDETRGKSGGPSVVRRDIVWHLTADLRAGASLRVSQIGDNTLDWPVHVEVRRGPPPMLPVGLIGGLLTLLALVVEARGRNRRNSGLTILAGAAFVFTVLFGDWFIAGQLTKGVAGTGFVSALVAGVAAAILVPIARRMRGGRALAPDLVSASEFEPDA